MGLLDWSATPARNSVADPTIPAEDGVAPRKYAGLVRSVMAGVRRYADARGGALRTSGRLNAYTVDPGMASELRPGIDLIIQADRTNTAEATLNVDSLGPLPWVDAGGVRLLEGRIVEGRFYHVILDAEAEAWRVQAGASTLDEIPGLTDLREDVATQAAAATEAAAAASLDAQTVVEKAAEVETTGQAVAVDRAVTTGLRAEVAADRTAIAGDRDATVAARDVAISTASSQTLQRDLASELPASGVLPQALAAYVLADPAPSSFGTRTGYWTRVSSTSPWVQRSADTVPGVSSRVTAEVVARRSLLQQTRIVIPGDGDQAATVQDPAGRVISTRKGIVRREATSLGLRPPTHTNARIVIPTLGEMDGGASVDAVGHVGSATKGGKRYVVTDAGLLLETQAGPVVVVGLGYVRQAVQDRAGRISAANRGGKQYRESSEGLFPEPASIARAVVPGYDAPEKISIDPAGRVGAMETGGIGYGTSKARGLVSTRQSSQGTEVDVLIYGGTLSGLMAAQRAARRGLSVVIVEPTAQTGGVISQGLTHTDHPMYGQTGLVGGLTRQVFNAIADEYGRPRPMWFFEPKAFDRVFNRLLIETGARVIEGSPINSLRDVSVRNGRIEGVRTREGWIACGVAIDASYEMDLARQAGAPWRMGREATTEFGEPSAGFRTSWGYSRNPVTPNNAYPVQVRPPLAEGDADGLIQPYSFRTVLTNAPDRIPFPEPPGGYSSSLADMVVAIVNNHGSTNFAEYVSLPIVSPPGAPYLKACINAPRLIGIELPGEQQAYPLATWARRREIVERHRRWEMNLLYCLANDPRIPAALRTSAQAWGFPADEWTDGAVRGFPDWPYIRESIRLRGAYTLTEFDLWAAANPLNTMSAERNAVKADRIARWAYFKDSHSMALYAEGATGLRATGNTDPNNHDVDPYDVPWRSLHTDPALSSHLSNLIVSACISTTSVAWMSARMEPLFGMCGEAAGEGAALMLGLGAPVQSIPYSTLAARLVEYGAVL